MGSMNREIKKISEDIKTNTFKQFYLFYGEEKYMILQMKDQLKRALISDCRQSPGICRDFYYEHCFSGIIELSERRCFL